MLVENVESYRRRARRRLPKPVFGYVDSGAEDEVTMGANRNGFSSLRFLPKLFQDVESIDLTATFAGTSLSLPVVLSPAGYLGMVHPDGEKSAPIAARRCGTLAIVSGNGSYSIEEVAAAQPDPGWLNVFPWGDRALIESILERGEAARFSGICLTVDTTVSGNRERDVENGWTAPPRLLAQAHSYAAHPTWVANLLRYRRCTLKNFDPEPVALRNFVTRASSSAVKAVDFMNRRFSWDDLAWLRGRWNGPLALKGAFRIDDAKRAVDDFGVDALLVGNHGGRQLDGLQSSLEQLPALAAAIGDRSDLVLEGGVRRGADVVKALCLGATAVSVGRPWVYGLAADGVDGVTSVLKIFEKEMRTVMSLLGAPNIASLDSSFVTSAGIVGDARATAA